LKNKRKFIFLTNEGFTFQEHSKEVEPDIENIQVVGTTEGVNPEDAFDNLLKENPYLSETRFNEIYCLELAKNAEIKKKYFWLKNRFLKKGTSPK